MPTKTQNRLSAVGGQSPSNDGNHAIDLSKPYIVEVEIEGTSDLLFHRWSNEAVKEKADARKGSAAKKVAFMVLGFAGGAVGAIGAILALVFTVTGRNGRRLLAVTALAIVLSGLAILVGAI